MILIAYHKHFSLYFLTISFNLEDEIENVLANYEKGVFTTSDINSAVDIRFEDKSKLNHIETVSKFYNFLSR